ncbi:hypothetical protein G7Y89_g875 [Cudoniella acicularis]|uniref:J domain-containing protein n=1 Tax=Cudoniella acicularis TaxID=354080 RepID=A0A8H4RWD3_9HELO|nr:hypothetical protein G7Y89_g875 [Cudoniella acicularis]
MPQFQDHYKVLGLSRRDNPDAATIKSAYRQQALIWHPDKNKDPNVTEIIKTINTAHEVLSDPRKRHQYDIQFDFIEFSQRFDSSDFQARWNNNATKDTHKHYSSDYSWTQGQWQEMGGFPKGRARSSAFSNAH